MTADVTAGVTADAEGVRGVAVRGNATSDDVAAVLAVLLAGVRQPTALRWPASDLKRWRAVRRAALRPDPVRPRPSQPARPIAPTAGTRTRHRPNLPSW